MVLSARVLRLKQRLPSLLAFYYALYSYQQIIVKYRIHYDRKRFRRIYENFSQYALTQYRALNPGKKHSKRYRSYPLSLPSIPSYLVFQKYFYLFYALRCFAIVCLKVTTDTEAKRIWIGSEWGKQDNPYQETAFGLWSTIGFLYCQFSLSSCLLDYKFLAIIEVSPKKPKYLRASDLGLSKDQLLCLYRFRRATLFFLHQSMISISILGPTSVVLLYLRASLYTTHLLISLFWTITLCYWTVAISALIFTNLIYFIILAKYLYLKQQSIIISLLRSLTHLLTNQRKVATFKRQQAPPGGKPRLPKRYLDRLVAANLRYTFLQDELSDYNRFWRHYLTFIFVIYVLLIGFLFFIIFFTNHILLGKITYAVVLCINWVILVTIITFGGAIYTANERLSRKFASLLGETPWVQMPVLQRFKMSNMSAYLKGTQSGFSLLNGYVINYGTLYWLIVNIIVYFMLIAKKIV